MLLIWASAFSQDNSYNLFQINDLKTADLREDLKRTVDDALIMNVDKNIYESLFEERNNKLNLTIAVSKNEKLYTSLERFEILSPDAKIIERSATGEKELDLRNMVLTYKGSVNGSDESLVTITFYNNKIVGLIRLNNETIVIGPLADRNNIETNDIAVYRESNLKISNNIRCGSENFEIPADVINAIKKLNGNPLDNLTTDLLDAKIAVDVDFYTYGVYGNSVPNASAYALAVMSASSAVYAKDMNIKLTVGYLRVWTTQDPYTSNNGNTLLDQFQAEWIANQGSVERVVAHLISRRTSIDVGGIAYVNVLCNATFGYGLSAVSGVINQLPAYSYDVVVVAHELGHNFGSPHTHSCSWVGGPIDSCYFSEGGCYTGPNIPTEGTIMSYCDTEGGTVRMDFGEQPEALIRNRAENAACVTVATRPLFTAYPNGGELFRTLTSGRIYWGTSLTGNVNLEYSTNNGSSWVTVENNVPAQNREYVWTIPYIGYTNQARVRILNSSNPAEGDTSDAAFRIILNYSAFSILSPPNLSTIETSPGNSSIHRFVWQKTGTHPSLRYKFKIRKVGGGAVDFIYDSDNGGADTAISLRNSFLDSLAVMIGTVGDSIRCSWRGWAYNGYDSTQSANSFLVTLKRTSIGVNVISTIVPEKFNLENNYPNPFNPATVINFDVAKAQNVKISVYDLTGREISILVNEQLQPGKYRVSFNGTNVSSGVYYYRMEADDFRMTKKMLLIR